MFIFLPSGDEYRSESFNSEKKKKKKKKRFIHFKLFINYIKKN